MEKNMSSKEIHLSTFMNPEFNRKAELSKDTYHYIVRMFENGQLMKTELLENHSVYYAEDLAENFVQKWGAFKDGN